MKSIIQRDNLIRLIMHYDIILRFLFKFSLYSISLLMDNYLIIDDIDTAYVTHNSWLVLLQKQISRNLYLFKQNGRNQLLLNKLNLKDLFAKLKSSINKHITAKIKNKKLLQKISRKPSPSPSLNSRRKTEQNPRLFNLKNFHNSISKTPKLANYRYLKQALQNDSSQYIQRKSSGHLSFLPCNKSSEQNKKENQEKMMTRKSVMYKFKLPKPFSQSKPILSLHQLEFNVKQLGISQNIKFNKRVANMETHLMRSSINSPKKCLNSESGIIEKKLQGCVMDRKFSEQLPMILSPNRINMSEILSHIRLVEGNARQQILDFGKVFESIRGEMIKSTKTQQTKQSQQQSGNGLDSIMEERMNEKAIDDRSFGDGCIKNNLSKNYRISRVRNIKFPVA